MENQLTHHGILGMRWGKRNGPPYPLVKTAHNKAGKKEKNVNKDTKGGEKQETKPKQVSDMSNDELKNAIYRLEMEKRYSDLTKPQNAPKISKGKAFVMDVMEKSAKNIATQAVTYAIGTALNKAVSSEIVNPKKGQKDK